VLAACADGGTDPYSWLAAAVPESSACLDLACGSAPMEPLIAGLWIGIDLAASELALARARRGDAPLIRADATELPLRTGGCESAVCVMALMAIPELESALAELTRVVRPGSTLTFLLPAVRPLPPRDRLRYLRLLAALRRTSLTYPRPDVLGRPARFLTRAGFIVEADKVRTFRYPIVDARAADTLVDSLYLPATAHDRVEAARRVARRWVGSDIGIPLRRVVVTPDPA
ncbi:MAG: class I SAM-dependent methyltransferase, partial [Acidimicrobiia bacterium]